MALMPVHSQVKTNAGAPPTNLDAFVAGRASMAGLRGLYGVNLPGVPGLRGLTERGSGLGAPCAAYDEAGNCLYTTDDTISVGTGGGGGGGGYAAGPPVVNPSTNQNAWWQGILGTASGALAKVLVNQNPAPLYTSQGPGGSTTVYQGTGGYGAMYPGGVAGGLTTGGGVAGVAGSFLGINPEILLIGGALMFMMFMMRD